MAKVKTASGADPTVFDPDPMGNLAAAVVATGISFPIPLAAPQVRPQSSASPLVGVDEGVDPFVTDREGAFETTPLGDLLGTPSPL
jgi:hypothetical protein